MQGYVNEYTTSGVPVSTPLITGLSVPNSIALDSAGHIFVSNLLGFSVGEYTTSGAVVNSRLIFSPNGIPAGVACDGQGHLFYSDEFYGVAEYTTAGVLLNSQVAPNFFDPTSIALDGQGNIFVAGPSGSVTVPIGEFTTTGAVVNPAVISGLVSPAGLQVEVVPEPSARLMWLIGGLAILLHGGHQGTPAREAPRCFDELGRCPSS